MADPTKTNRDAFKSGVRKVLPSSSPLGKSMTDSKKEEDAQLAADEANNLVMQRAPVELPVEAQNFGNPASTVTARVPAQQAASDEKLVPSEELTSQGAQPLSASGNSYEVDGISPSLKSGLKQESNALAEQGKNIADLYGQEAQQYEQQSRKLEEVKANYEKSRLEMESKRQLLEDNAPKMSPADIFKGKSTWQKIAGGIGLFLGSITPEGARNVANIIDKAVKEDYKLQESEIVFHNKKLGQVDNHLAKLKDAYKDDLLAETQFRINALAKIKSQMEIQKNTASSKVAVAAYDKGIGIIEQDMQKSRDAHAARVAEKASKESKPSERQSKAATFANLADKSEEVISKLMKAKFDPTSVNIRALKMLPQEMVPSSYQQYKQAAKQFTMAKLRDESGAAIPATEYESDFETYFPQPGDGKEVVVNKAAARKAVIEGLKVASGNQFEKIKERLVPEVEGFKAKK